MRFCEIDSSRYVNWPTTVKDKAASNTTCYCCYGHSIFGEKVATFAMHEFLGWPEPNEMPNEDGIERAEGLFWPWLVFNWEHDHIEDEENLLDGPEDMTIAELYRANKRIKSESPEGRLIAATNRC